MSGDFHTETRTPQLSREKYPRSHQQRQDADVLGDEPMDLGPDVADDQDPVAEEEERSSLVRVVLNSLPQRAWEALLRFYLDEQPEDRICAEMEITETQFRLIKSRAKARFGELIQEKGVLRERPPVGACTRRTSSSDSQISDMDRIVPVIAHAVAVFGDEHKASHWLATPLRLLGNLSPSQVLARGDGEVIEQILTRIEYNIPS